MAHQINLCLYNIKGQWLDPSPRSMASLYRNHPAAFRQLVAELIEFLRKEQLESAQQLELFAPWEVKNR